MTINQSLTDSMRRVAYRVFTAIAATLTGLFLLVIWSADRHHQESARQFKLQAEQLAAEQKLTPAPQPQRQSIKLLGHKVYADKNPSLSQTVAVYYLAGDWSEKEFQTICTIERSKNDGSFRVVAVFDSQTTAQYPSNPPSAFYGTDIDAMRHIIADYTHNRLNNFEQTRIHYPGNAWEK